MSNRHTFPDGYARVQDAVVAHTRAGADDDVRMDDLSGTHGGAGPNHGEGTN